MTIKSEELIHLLDKDLALHDLSNDGSWKPEATLQEAAAIGIRRSLTQKWEYESTDQANAAALDKFLACNERCGKWLPPDLSLTGRDAGASIDVRAEILIGELKTLAWDFWLRKGYPLVDHPFQCLEEGTVGPGSNIGARGESFYAKLYASPLTCTSPKLYNWYRRYTDKFPYMQLAEEFRSCEYGGHRVVAGSRLSFVPKNVEISRCICTEPTLNTFFQLGFGTHIERRLRERYGIALRDQQFVNRGLARLGSITDNLATLDLSSASDCISNRMLKWLLPPDFYRWLQFMRCTETEIPGVGTVVLEMVSSMGNGFTFPLETMLFTLVVVASLKARGIPCNRSESSNLWGVYGDDIICPALVVPDVIFLLDLLGFKVNDDKSFVKGPFRESCGADFFRGSPVRGIYLKDLSTEARRYSAINQLTRFSTRTGISLPNVIGRLLTSVRWLPVPRWENMDAGIHVPRHLALPIQKDRHTQSDVYHALVAQPVKVRFTDGGDVVVPSSCKSLVYNSSGLLTSVLQGSVNADGFSVRVDRARYRRKRRISPNWDWCGLSSVESQDYALDWGRWDTVLELLTERL